LAGPSDFDKRLAQVESVLEQIRGMMSPGIVTDPAPDDLYPKWPFPRWPRPWPFPYPFPSPFPNPIADPAPVDWLRSAALGAADRRAGAVFGPNVDPSPVDFSRFTAVQLEGVRDLITLERKRLDALDDIVGAKIKALKG
jgi:hypothetical protein